MEEEEEKISWNLDDELNISSPEEKSTVNNVKSKKTSKTRKLGNSSKPKLDLISGNYENNKDKKKSDKKYFDNKSSDVTSSEKYINEDCPSPITSGIEFSLDKKEKKRSNDALSSNLTNFTAKKKKKTDAHKYTNTSSNTLHQNISTHPPLNNQPIIDITQSPITSRTNHSRGHSNRRNRNRSGSNDDEAIARRLQNEHHSEVTPTFTSDEEYARYLQRKENETRTHFHDMSNFYDMDRIFSRHFNYSFNNSFYNEVNPISFAPLALSILNANSRTNLLQHFLRYNNNNTSVLGNGASNPRNLMLMNRDFNENDYEMLLQLDEGVEKRKGASKTVINSLPVQEAAEGETLSCCICLCDMEPGTKVRRLPCLHYFHVECIDKWLEVNKVCPIDKKPIDNSAE